MTQLKAQLSGSSFNRVEREHQMFLLGYTYYMKAKAELTFMEARKQNIVLKEDFSEKESKMFTVEYFKAKATRSLAKSTNNFKLWKDVAEYVNQIAAKIQ